MRAGIDLNQRLHLDRKLGDHISNCFAQAAEAKRQADATADADANTDFLSLERTWLELAHQYQFMEGLERFLMNECQSAVGRHARIDDVHDAQAEANFRAKVVKFPHNGNP
jgi:hypothetical protein